MIKERDDQLDNTIARYEERLVELHSVIAELSRQVEEKSRQQINEEDTEDEEDHTVMGGNKDNTAVASRTSTEVDAQAIEVSKFKHFNHCDFPYFLDSVNCQNQQVDPFLLKKCSLVKRISFFCSY